MNRVYTGPEPDLFTYINEQKAPEELTLQGEEEVRWAFSRLGPSGDCRYQLKTESYLLKLAHAYKKIMSLSNSRTRILAHQVESTHIIVNSLNKRYLIADEVGLGKTIEAGLVIKEFIYRYNYERILIACPASLLNQWQNEMSGKFNENFVIMDRKLYQKTKKEHGRNANPWRIHSKILCSLDFMKNKAFSDELSESGWDSVIFDEAHRLRRDSNHSTQVYLTAEMIAERTKSLLLLSATPFRGKLEELFYLIALLDKNIFGPVNSFINQFCCESADLSLLKDRISKVVIRRTKKDVGGFTARHASTVRFNLYPEERMLYEETTRYVVEEFNRAMQTENRAVGFVMTVFQKLLDSSSYALSRALRKRKIRLEKTHEQASRIADNVIPEDYEDADFIDEELYGCSADKTAAEIAEEIKTIERLISLSEVITKDKKGEKLLKLIKDLRKKGNRKFLIFTQFKTTQEYLADLLSEFDVCLFHGSLNRDEKEEAILNFKERAEILIATEAGGEGRNMQFCNIIINYDLPWSPLKIEQRIGRLHRFGQDKDVFIYNFSTRDTVAERVLEVLTHKLKLFEESIGTPDILLGQIEDELNLGRIFMEMHSGKLKKREAETDIDERIQNARKCYEKLSDLTVADRMDFNYDEYYKITMKERRFSNNRIEKFINSLRAFYEEQYQEKFEIGKKESKTGLYPVETVNGKKYGTFDSTIALENEEIDFLAFGHPIIEEIIAETQSHEFGGYAGVKYISYGRQFSGTLFNYIVTIRSVGETREIMPVFIDLNGVLDRDEIKEIEAEALEEEPDRENPDANKFRPVFEKNVFSFERSLALSKIRINEKIRDRIRDISDSLDLEIDPELEKIKESFDKRLKELDEKLQRQEAKKKWENRDMKSAITRTTNEIKKAAKERDTLLARYSGYTRTGYSLKLLNAAVVIGY